MEIMEISGVIRTYFAILLSSMGIFIAFDVLNFGICKALGLVNID